MWREKNSTCFVASLFWSLQLIEFINAHLFYSTTAYAATTSISMSTSVFSTLCSCNKYATICDPLCCCDTSCSAAETTLWKDTWAITCSTSNSVASVYCYEKSQIYKINEKRGLTLTNSTNSDYYCIEGSDTSIDSNFIDVVSLTTTQIGSLTGELSLNNTDYTLFTKHTAPATNTTYYLQGEDVVSSTVSGTTATQYNVPVSDKSNNFDCIKDTDTVLSADQITKTIKFGQDFSVSCSASISTANCNSTYFLKHEIFSQLDTIQQKQDKKGSQITISTEEGTLSTIIKLDGSSCTMPKSITVYVFYYPFEQDVNGTDYYYAISKVSWVYDKADTIIHSAAGDYNGFKLTLKWMDISLKDPFNKTPDPPSLFPKELGEFMGPLMRRNWNKFF